MAKRLDLNIDFQKCRRWGHCWDDTPPYDRGGKKVLTGLRLYFRCDRCSMRKVQIFNSWGQGDGTYYDAPDGYKLAKDDVPTTEQLNLSLIQISRATQRVGTPTHRQPRTQPAPRVTARGRSSSHRAPKQRARRLKAVS